MADMKLFYRRVATIHASQNEQNYFEIRIPVQ